MNSKHIFYAVFCNLFSFSILLGQDYGAEFEVNSEIGCDQFTVVVTDLSGAPDTVAINYDWGDGSPLDSATSHTYSRPGNYMIIQTVANADPRQDTAFIEVIEHYPPEFLLLSCKGMSASVIVEDTLYEAYEVEWGDGSSDVILANAHTIHNYAVFNNYDVTVKGLINPSQAGDDLPNLNCSSTTKRLNMINDISAATINEIRVLDTDNTNGTVSIEYTLVPGNNYLIEIKDQNQLSFQIIDTINQVTNPTSYILENLNTEDNYYCINITAFDPCDGETRPSNTGCSINIETAALNQQNQISWQTLSTDFQNYQVIKDGTQVATIGNQGTTEYNDQDVSCGILYEYQVQLQEINGLISVSDTSNAIAISTDIPDPIQNVTASIDGQNISISWEEPSAFLAVGYIIYRSSNGGPFVVLDTLSETSYTDEDLFTQSNEYTYKIIYFDACDNISAESILAVPVLLTKVYDNTITWSAYQGWENNVREYILEKYDENGQLIETINLGQSTSFIEDEEFNPYQYILYRISANPNDASLGVAYSNYLEVIYPSKVAFPNAFSPNGDGLNDIFTFESRYITSATIKIYNRWGELVYQTTDFDKGWDGTVNGKAAPLGTYIHHTELTDDMGITFVKSGEIVLIR